MNIAIVGSGIAGLSSAWLLAQRHQVTVFEANNYAGGHSHAVDITLDGLRYPVDTGFLVFNDKTYPNLVKLFQLLNVATTHTDMSFSVRLPQANLEWAGSDQLRDVFAQKQNLIRPRFWRMLADILRFNRQAERLLTQYHQQTLGELLQQEGYSQAFAEWYLLPMGAAIWSTPINGMLDFPAQTFLRFCLNHGLLQVNNRPQWQTVTGSSREYVKRLVHGIGDVRLNSPVSHIKRHDTGVELLVNGELLAFDAVVLATHSDQSLRLLRDADAQEQQVLSAIRYAPNVAYLHTDISLMPKRRSAWAAWNYYTGQASSHDRPVAVTYWLNRLQPLPFKKNVFVTLNPPEPIAAAQTLAVFDYAHPQLDQPAYHAQLQVNTLQGRRHTYFCGAWAGYGFHEDGLKSALRVAQALQCPIPWQPIWESLP